MFLVAAALSVVLALLLLLRPAQAPGPSGAPTLSPATTLGVSPGATAGTAARTPTTSSSAPSTPGGTSGAIPGDTPVVSEVFVGAGDIADCRSEGDSQTAAILDALPGAQVFTLGDNAYEDGTREQFDQCYGPTWGRHRDRTWPSPGNHEYRTSGAAGYFDYFGERAGPSDRGWYAFDLGEWRVYSLNSNCGEIGGCGRDSRQVAWLRDDLAQNPARCSLAFMHHPRFSSGEHGSDESLNAIWVALSEAGAELVLAGHDHSYERFQPMDAAGAVDQERGVTMFVVGTGGRSHYGFKTILPTSAARSSGVWGVLELTLSPEGWSSRFIPVSGGSYTDRASGTCH